MFKNKKVGIILVLIGLFIPIVLYPHITPKNDNYVYDIVTGKHKIGRSELVFRKGAYITETNECYRRIAIPYKYFISLGITLVFTGVGIITGFQQSTFFYFSHGNMLRKIGGWYRIGIIFIFVGFFVPSVLYPFTEHPSFIVFRQENILRQGESVIVLKRGKQIADPQIHRRLLYFDGTYLYYKHILAGGIILIFLGIGIITLNSRKWKQKDA